MPDPITPDDDLLQTARAYLEQMNRAVPRANLPERVISSAMSRRRRVSIGALLGGGALVIAGTAAAVVAVAVHDAPAPQRPLGPVGHSPAITSASPTVSPSALPSPSPSPSAPAAAGGVTITLVTAHDHLPNTGDGPGPADFRGGHSLTCNTSIRYDNTVVARVTNASGDCMLSPNGLHYLYSAGRGEAVDGHPIAMVAPGAGGYRYLGALSNDGRSVVYEISQPSPDSQQGIVTLYRNTTVLYHDNESQTFDFAASADLQHYVVVDRPRSTAAAGLDTVEYDGRVVASIESSDFYVPIISANGMHWGVYISGSNNGGHALVDGRAVAGPWECAALITNSGHWTMFNVVTNSTVTDGVSRHVSVDSLGNAFVALTDGAEHRATVVNGYTSLLTVDGSRRSVPAYPRGIEFVGSTLYVYYLAQ